TCGSFPSEEAAFKLLYLALRDVAAKWHTIQNWKEVLNRLAILWEDRFPQIVS
ncbi:MAG: IS256 family transposase, partial [Acidobacteriaceae bacterium]|nr:IS256 family transposase [Acidobacteriaceae bacterium]